jgi:hypothetical protein
MWKVTCEGILTSIISGVDKKIKKEVVFKKIESCLCDGCIGRKYETIVFLGTTEV